MFAGQIQIDVHVGQLYAIASLHRELHAPVIGFDIDSTHLRICIETITRDGSRDIRQDTAHGGIIGTQNRRAIKRHAMQKLNERLFQIIEIMAISVHMVCINIGHHGHHWQQIQK